MSTTILETETFSVTRFFGGRYRGVCYQISMAGSPGYVQLTRDEAVLLRSALTDELFGDPSEATPSKENAPECPERELPRAKDSRLQGKKYLYPEAAPIPEVQGTPTKEICICDPEGRGWDRECPIHGDYAPEGDYVGIGRNGPMVRTAPPVGTPQKETPPDFTCEECDSHCCITAGGSKLICYHCYLAKAAPVPEGVQGLEPKTTPRRKCGKCGAKTYWHGNTWYHCDGADVAKCGMVEPQTPPEGVQGKEPPHETPGPKQAPTEYQQVSRQIMARMRELHIPIPEGDCGPLQFFNAACASREAAGRRSAITKFEKWAESQKSGLDEEATGKIMDWCAELQEKTK